MPSIPPDSIPVLASLASLAVFAMIRFAPRAAAASVLSATAGIAVLYVLAGDRAVVIRPEIRRLFGTKEQAIQPPARKNVVQPALRPMIPPPAGDASQSRPTETAETEMDDSWFAARDRLRTEVASTLDQADLPEHSLSAADDVVVDPADAARKERAEARQSRREEEIRHRQQARKALAPKKRQEAINRDAYRRALDTQGHLIQRAKQARGIP